MVAAPIKASFVIYYDRGAKKYETKENLQPDDQMWIDIGELIRRQVPDKAGNVLPADLSGGSYQFNDLTHHGIGSLFEGKVIYDKTYGHVSYGCASCCGDQYPIYFLPSPFGVVVSFTGQIEVTATDGCSGGQDGITEDFSSWASSNTSVATVNASTALVTGMNAGTATQSSPGSYEWGGLDIKHCSLRQATPSGPANVLPTVAVSCTKQHLSLGSSAPASTVNGSCTATATPTGGTYNWSVNKSTVSITGSGASVGYTAAAASSASGDTTISVKYTSNSQSASATSPAITVHKPTSLTASAVNANGTSACTLPCLTTPGSGTCNATPGTSCTYAANQFRREYKVLDQFGTFFQDPSVGINEATVTESVSLTSNNCGGTGVDTGSSAYTDFFDDFGKRDTCCQQGGPGCTTTAAQTILVNGFSVRQTTITATCTTVTVAP